jgi:sigma-E factor negative regulatory protein RseA
MNDATHEQLSALIDGELPRDELRFLLRRLDSDSALAQRWSRYQIVSAVLKREYAPATASEQFVSGVMARLDAEVRQAPPRAGMGSRFLRWAGGGAIAASVAVVALLATRPAGTDLAGPAQAAPTVTVAAAPATTPAAPVGELHQPLLPQQMLPGGFADYAQPASFESIVPNYAAVPRNSGSQMTGDGFVPYVLVVGARQAAAEQPQPVVVRQAPQKKH